MLILQVMCAWIHAPGGANTRRNSSTCITAATTSVRRTGVSKGPQHAPRHPRQCPARDPRTRSSGSVEVRRSRDRSLGPVVHDVSDLPGQHDTVQWKFLNTWVGNAWRPPRSSARQVGHFCSLSLSFSPDTSRTGGSERVGGILSLLDSLISIKIGVQQLQRHTGIPTA
jgi:hypothetical protein